MPDPTLIKTLAHLIPTKLKWRDEIDTPAVVIDLDVVENNLRHGANRAHALGLNFRPHIKTHKIPLLAQAQLELGATGITAQKISEAEVMVDAGIKDVLISFNIVGPKKLVRLHALSQRASLRTVADNSTVIEGLAAQFGNATSQLGVLVEIDGGLSRCGVTTVAEAVALAVLIDQKSGLRFDGLMIYPAPKKWQQAVEFLEDCRTGCLAENLPVRTLSTGGTPDFDNVVTSANLTEYRAGSYIYNDRSLVNSRAVGVEDCALTVFTTVISTPTQDRAIVDGGSKSLTSDLFGMTGHGLVKGRPGAEVFGLSEEHGHLRFPMTDRPAVGDRLEIIPNHSCVVSNLVDHVNFVRGDYLVGRVPVSARGTVE